MQKIFDYLNELYPNPQCELNYNSNFELLVAVMLSAQCTDKRVNAVTEKLFKKASMPAEFAKMPQEELEKEIYSCGFYRNKAKNIISASKDIVNRFNGEVPENIEDLTSLAGVGKKTANVVVSVAFGGDAIAVDTHVFRVSHRLGLSNSKTPEKCQLDLENKIPKALWSKFHYQLVLFGRYKCKAIKPECEECGLKEVCRFYKEKNLKQKEK